MIDLKNMRFFLLLPIGDNRSQYCFNSFGFCLGAPYFPCLAALWQRFLSAPCVFYEKKSYNERVEGEGNKLDNLKRTCVICMCIVQVLKKVKNMVAEGCQPGRQQALKWDGACVRE